MMGFSEANAKLTLSVGLIITGAASLFWLGMFYERQTQTDQQVKMNYQLLHDYADQEIGGLRSDVNALNGERVKDIDINKASIEANAKRLDAIMIYLLEKE